MKDFLNFLTLEIFMKRLLFIAVLALTPFSAFAETTQIAGKINFADCGGVIAKPAQKVSQRNPVV